MYRPGLPEPRKDAPAALTDAAAQQAWVSTLPPAAAPDVLTALTEQVEAVDASTLAAPQAITLLNALRTAAVARLGGAESRFTRKALPMLPGEEATFLTHQKLWTALGIAYLRLTPGCTPANRCLPLHRAANAFRIAQYSHYLAAQSCPASLDQLLFDVLASAEANGMLKRPLPDPDFPQYGKGSVSGEIVWAFLLRASDPYRLTALQLPVTNKIFSRWRELVPMEATAPTEDPTIDLARFGAPEDLPGQHYLNIRTVLKKLRERLQLLKEGHSPEALKLGRTLSIPSAGRLLHFLETRFTAGDSASYTLGTLEADVAYGAEHAYAVIKNHQLNAVDEEGAAKRSVAYQRLALFGVDRIADLPPEMQRLNVPSERWHIVNGDATRQTVLGNDHRLLAPSLVGAMLGPQRRLGILTKLRGNTDGSLHAEFKWFDEAMEAGSLKRLAPQGNRLYRVPAFLKIEGEQCQMILPIDCGARLGTELELSGHKAEVVEPVEVLERGSNFVRYACKVIR